MFFLSLQKTLSYKNKIALTLKKSFYHEQQDAMQNTIECHQTVIRTAL